jgi:hypothetical protein
MMQPLYAAQCTENQFLSEAVDGLLEAIETNAKRGYKIDTGQVVTHITNGMTLDTFNQLVLTINSTLNDQFRKGIPPSHTAINRGVLH